MGGDGKGGREGERERGRQVALEKENLIELHL